MVAAFTKNKNAKTLTLNYSSVLKVSVAKEDINGAAALNFSISSRNFLSAKDINKLDASKVVQLDFAGEGKLDGVDKVSVKYRVGAKFIGQTVNVYEYVNGKLVKVGTGKVNAAGIVKFNTDHYGQFVLAVE